MKPKNLLSLLLLLALGFSIVHEFVITHHEKSHQHCDVTEYVLEFSKPVADMHDSGDLCESHHLFHVSFILTQPLPLAQPLPRSQKPLAEISLYPVHLPGFFLKPPIS